MSKHWKQNNHLRLNWVHQTYVLDNSLLHSNRLSLFIQKKFKSSNVFTLLWVKSSHINLDTNKFFLVFKEDSVTDESNIELI